MSSMDRFTIHSQLQHLQSKYPGTGNADTSRVEWALNIQRDTLASHVGHYSRLAYFAVAENESLRRIRYRCLSQMICPGGGGETAGEAPAEASASSEGTGKETDKETVKETAERKTEAAETAEEKEEETETAMEEGEDL